MSNQESVVIIGGGFGGVYAAKHLLRAGLSVTLVSDRNYFTFMPLLHEVATGNLVTHDIVFEYESFFKHKNFHFVSGKVTALNTTERTVMVQDAAIPYTYVILATGAVTNHYDISGIEHAFELKSIADAIALKQAIISRVQSLKHSVAINVIGAGPTGIELVLEIDQLLKQLQKNDASISFTLRLLNASETILRPYPKKVQSYAAAVLNACDIPLEGNVCVAEITPTSVLTNAGKVYDSDITILAAGVVPNVSYVPAELLDKDNHVAVNEYLQSRDQHVFALGDIVAINGKSVPKLAQIATDQANIVAQNIAALVNGASMNAYSMKLKGMLISLGKGKAAGVIGSVVVTGFIAWFIWRTVYLFKTPGLVNKLRVAFSWTLNLWAKRNTAEQ